MFKVGRGVDRLGVRRRTGSVVLGLLATLATVLGMACLCSDGHAVRPVVVAVSAGYESPDDDAREHICIAPGHHRCGGKATVDTPVTGPGSHPFPSTPPARVDARPALPPTPVTMRTAPARPPDLHALQVLRT